MIGNILFSREGCCLLRRGFFEIFLLGNVLHKS